MTALWYLVLLGLKMAPEHPQWRVALIDSGAGERALRAARFAKDGSGPLPAAPDPTGHGSRLASLWSANAPAHTLLLGQVFSDEGPTTPAAVAAAIHWAIGEQAQLVHLSLGLREDRAWVAVAVARAVKAGLILVAATPAQGSAVYPAGYPGVLKATGDARCEALEISALGESHFGACVRYPDSFGDTGRGASVGAGYVTAAILRLVTPGAGSVALRATLTAAARYHGPERRTG